ncbi:MAG: class I SAM-dependent methyltransferase [Ekhidna sp.]
MTVTTEEMPNNIEADSANQKVARLLMYIAENYPTFLGSIQQILESDHDLFYYVANRLVNWAANSLGKGYEKILVDGYLTVMYDSMKANALYQKQGQYPQKSFQDVFESLYNNPPIMSKYYWGIYSITFLLDTYLQLYQYYEETFVKTLVKTASKGKILELGSGSGLWSLTLLEHLQNWQVLGIDFSETSVTLSNNLAKVNGFNSQIKYNFNDPLTLRQENEFDAAISFYLVDRLKEPQLLFQNLANHLRTGGYAFLATTLTNAMSYHLYEYRRESELLLQAEENSFRVISYLSTVSTGASTQYQFVPRHIGLFMQKRRNDIW